MELSTRRPRRRAPRTVRRRPSRPDPDATPATPTTCTGRAERVETTPRDTHRGRAGRHHAHRLRRLRRRLRRRGRQDPHLLGQQPGHQPGGRQADPPARAGQVRAADRHQGQRRGRRRWSDLLNRILAAATSGQGPDVVNIGNTWSASLQATGALLPFDDAALARRRRQGPVRAGRARRRRRRRARPRPRCRSTAWPTASTTTRSCSPTPASPARRPPGSELVADGKKLTNGGKWGLAVEGANPSENAHHAFTFGQQYGGEWFDSAGKPTFDTPQNVAGVKQYVDLMAADKIVNPSNAEYAQNQSRHRLRQRQGRHAAVAGRRRRT